MIKDTNDSTDELDLIAAMKNMDLHGLGAGLLRQALEVAMIDKMHGKHPIESLASAIVNYLENYQAAVRESFEGLPVGSEIPLEELYEDPAHQRIAQVERLRSCQIITEHYNAKQWGTMEPEFSLLLCLIVHNIHPSCDLSQFKKEGEL